MEYPKSELHTKMLMEEDKIKVAQTQAREREREIYNEAIEDAAKTIDKLNRDGPYQSITGATEIRKLKK